jgi:hypothetical protein
MCPLLNRDQSIVAGSTSRPPGSSTLSPRRVIEAGSCRAAGRMSLRMMPGGTVQVGLNTR